MVSAYNSYLPACSLYIVYKAKCILLFQKQGRQHWCLITFLILMSLF